MHTAAGGWREGEGEDSPLRSAARMVGYRKPNSIIYRDANINIRFEGVQIDRRTDTCGGEDGSTEEVTPIDQRLKWRRKG